MARKPPNSDAAAKLLINVITSIMKNKAPAKVRYEIQKNLPDIAARAKMPVDGRTTKKVGKIAAVKPSKKPTVTRKRSGGLIQNEAEKRGVEKEANFWLRNQKDLKPSRKPSSSPRSSFEADKLRRESASDRNKIGKGQAVPKKRKPTPRDKSK